MALEKFNNTTKALVVNDWYPNESKSYIRHFINDVQRELGFSIYNNMLRKDEIKAIVKHFGKPQTIKDEDYVQYVQRLKTLEEW